MLQKEYYQSITIQFYQPQIIYSLIFGLFCSTMVFHYSLKEITLILDQILKPENNASLKEASEKLLTMENCQNFVEEFFALALHPQLNQNQKMLTLTAIQRYSSSRKSILIDLNLINSIFAIFNSEETSNKYKQKLVDFMSNTNSFMEIRQDIKNLILFRLENLQINEDDLYIIYISQFIMGSNENWSGQVDFIILINECYFRIANYICLNFSNKKNSNEQLYQIVKLFKSNAYKLQNTSYQKQIGYLNSQITDFLLQCLRLPFRKQYEGKTKTLIFELMGLILTISCECMERGRSSIKIVAYLPKLVEEVIEFLGKIQILGNTQQWNRSVESSTKIVLKVYKNPFLVTQTCKLSDRQLMRCLIKLLSLKKHQYDNYYFNPIEFITFLQNLLLFETKKISKPKQFHQNQDDHLGYPRKLDGSYTVNTLGDDVYEDCMENREAYHYICTLIEEICKKNEVLAVEIMDLIMKGLQQEIQIEDLEHTTSLILLGILKNEISKRPQIHYNVQQFLQKELFQNQIPTSHTQQPENIFFLITLTVLQKYLRQLCLNNQNEFNLFKLLHKIIQTKKVEVPLALLSIEMLGEFIHKTEYALYIIDLIKNKLEETQNLLVFTSLLKVYEQFLKNAALSSNSDTLQTYHCGISMISTGVSRWIKSQKLYAVNYTIFELLFEYKTYISLAPSRLNIHEVLDLDLINQLKFIRNLLMKAKDDPLRLHFDTTYLNTFHENLEKDAQKKIGIKKSQEQLLLQILDHNIRIKQYQLFISFKNILKLLLNHKECLIEPIVQRVHQILSLLLQSYPSGERLDTLQLTLLYIILQFDKFTQKQVLDLHKDIQKHCLNFLEETNQLRGHLLIIKMAISLKIPSILNENSLEKQIYENLEELNSSRQTNQISVYLICKIIRQLVHNKKLSLIQPIFLLLIPLVESNLQGVFHCNQMQDEEYPEKEKLDIDEWSELRQVLHQLNNCGLWEELRTKIGPKQQQVLKNSFLCQKMDRSSRIIYKIKI